MAKIISKPSKLEDRYTELCAHQKECLQRSAVAFLIPLFALPLAAALLYPQYLDSALGLAVMIGFFAGFICMVPTGKYAEELSILQAGVSGERAAAKQLAKLPEEYTCYRNLLIRHNGSTSELDMVVTGPTGVYIVEIKNMRGTFTGSYNDHHWTQHKVGRGGGHYTKEVYNPIRQVGTHTYRLAGYLREHGANVRVESTVYFTRADACLRLRGEPGNTSVFVAGFWDSSKKLRRHILGSTAALSPAQLQQVNALLERA